LRGREKGGPQSRLNRLERRQATKEKTTQLAGLRKSWKWRGELQSRRREGKSSKKNSARETKAARMEWSKPLCVKKGCTRGQDKHHRKEVGFWRLANLRDRGGRLSMEDTSEWWSKGWKKIQWHRAKPKLSKREKKHVKPNA